MGIGNARLDATDSTVIDLRDGAARGHAHDLPDRAAGATPIAPEGEVRARIEAARDAVVAARSGAESWPDDIVAECVVDLTAVAADAERAVLVAVAELDRRALQARDGTKSVTSWLKAWCGMSGVAAAARARGARHLSLYPKARGALLTGTITPAHLDLLAHAAKGARAAQYAAHEDMLLGVAADTPAIAAFDRALSGWIAAADDQRRSADPSARYEERQVSLAMQAYGMLELRAVIDEHGTPILIEALEDLSRPDPDSRPGGPRTRPQRLADALVELARRHLQGRNSGGSGPIATVDLVISAELVARWLTQHAHHLPPEISALLDGTIDPGHLPANNPDGAGDPGGGLPATRHRRTRARRDASRRARALAGGLSLPESGHAAHDGGEERRPPVAGAVALGGLAAEIFRTGTLCREVAEVFCCDASWGATLFNAAGEVLYHGRTHRRFTRAQRRAIFVRDRGCVFPGCGRPPEWCDVHHLDFWDNGGPTDLDNGCLLCRHCHVLVHQGWILTHRRTGWTSEPPAPGAPHGGDDPPSTSSAGPAGSAGSPAFDAEPLTPVDPASRGPTPRRPTRRPTTVAG